MKFVFLLLTILTITISSLPFINSARVIPLDSGKEQGVNILSEGKTSICLHSGFVALKKGESIGFHNSKSYEELIIVLSGKGKFEIKGKDALFFTRNDAIYCPPFTEHNITNIGEEELKYVYVVTNTALKGRKDAHS